jgi:hypothetical protein
LAQQLCAGALAFGQEHFDWSQNVARLERFYDEIRVTQQEPAHGPTKKVS